MSERGERVGNCTIEAAKNVCSGDCEPVSIGYFNID